MGTLGSRNINVFTLFVEDLKGAMSFYQEIFGLSVVFEYDNSAVFDFGNMSINLLKISEAQGLIDPGTVASREAEAGSRFQFTIRVDDVDAVCNELKTLGVALLNGPMNRLWGVRTASFTDPGGHIWEIAQQLT
jgi:catechol 2,3-dioxygenase-like lactoylglutathione lyase family enzyme